MSRKQGKTENASAAGRGTEGRSKMHLKLHSSVDTKHKENVVKRLSELFQESFDLDIIQSVALTCQWDFGKSTEALIVLGGTTQPQSRRSRRVNSLVESSSSRYKTKSLPSTLKGHRSQSGRLSDSSTQSMPNGLRAHPAYFSNDSLASGQVWQRHYKSKPQSPGLLTMIQPVAKDVGKLQKPGSSRSSSQASMHKESPEVKQTSAVILRIEKLIQNNVKVMVLMRGVPGSGKTHLAQVVVNMVAANDRGEHIFSTDDYFVMLGRGVYAYDPNQLSQAHNWNQKRVSEALRRATNPVVVDNTHTQAWEMRPYVTMGVAQGYLIEVLEPVTPWRTREAELARRNVHNVPREKIRQMLDRYEPGWTGDKLLNLFQLKYQHCGAAHVSPELTGFSNSPLAQHRQHSSMEQPEKPKRKKSNMGKKDRRQVPGVEINNSQEQQLEELNKLFAEYGKTIDPESRQKVIDAGVPIIEVVSRIRKLQGTLLPLPGIPPSIIEEGPNSVGESPPEPDPVPIAPSQVPPDYLGLHRRSPTDSVEPDTMSSSNASETSECESDSEPEPLRRYLDDCGGHFVDGEDQWEDEEEAKSEGAVSSRPSGKCSGLVTSSQEELSIIDYQLSTPAGSSQDELSLLEFERGSTPNRSSTSSEEPKTELSTLQDSLRDVLLRSAAAQLHSAALDPMQDQLMRDIASQTGSAAYLMEQARQPIAFEGKVVQKAKDKTAPPVPQPDYSTNDVENQLASMDINDSLLEILRKRFMTDENKTNQTPEQIDEDIPESIKTAKSPDLEEIPLPCIPEAEEIIEKTNSGKSKREGPKLETIVESIRSPPDTDLIDTRTSIGAIRGAASGLLKNFNLNWAAIPMTSSSTVILPEPPQRPERPESRDNESNTETSDFSLWKSTTAHILNTVSRDINPPDTPIPVRSKAAVAMFDKGTMTIEEDEAVQVELDDGLQALIVLFPDVRPADLADLLQKCNHDVQWAAELITDNATTFQMSEAAQSIPAPEPVDSKLETLISDGKKTIKRKKDRKYTASEVTQMLKKEIESSFQIGSEHYSDHLLYIKKVREGEFTLDDPVPDALEEAYRAAEEEQIAEEAKKAAEIENDGEKTLPMPVDPTFFQTLVNRFGGPLAATKDSFKGFKPIINIPESLARSLYWLWVETLNADVAGIQENDDDDMLKADALLAAALHEQELQERQPTMQELVDMDIAEKMMKKDQEVRSEKHGDTLAAVLSRKLLFEKYPNLDKGALLQVLQCEGYSLQKACDTLKELYGEPHEPTCSQIELALQQSMIDRAAHAHDLTKEKPRPMIVVKEATPRLSQQDPERDVLVVDPSGYRCQIQMLQQRRTEYLQLGQTEMAKKNYSTATHFFQEASRLKEKIREAQETSISQYPFPCEGSSLPTTLDLHYLFTGEALQFVDLFLDQHITRLPSGRLDLFLITGRGQRSPSGLSRIKPAVQKRLVERQLSFVEDNPGMIRVTIHPNDLLSTAL